MEKAKNPFVFPGDSLSQKALDTGFFYADEVQWDHLDDDDLAPLVSSWYQEYSQRKAAASALVNTNAAMIARDAPQATPKIVSQSQVEADIREKELALLQELMRKHGVPAMPVPEKVKESTPVGLTMVANTTHRLGVNAWQNRD